MTKDVTVTICGRQHDIGDEPVIVSLPGTYYHKNEKHYVLYEELLDDGGQLIKNRVKFNDGFFEMTRKGAVSSTMLFKQAEKTTGRYNTGTGVVFTEVDTHNMEISETESMLQARITYALSMNGQFVSECEVDFKVMAQED